MKTTYIRYKFLIAILSVGVFGSCDVLDTPVPIQVGEDYFWQTESDAQRAITGCYTVALEEYYYGHNSHVFDCISDDLYRAGDWASDTQIETLNPQADDSEVIGNLWTRGYEGVRRANEVLRNVPNMNIDEKVKGQILGQAYFLRAFHYWRLVLTFGGVPLIDEDLATSEYNRPRNSKEETYAFIIEDLEKATSMLPLEWGSADLGRPVQGAAWGMLARMYMFLEQWDNVLHATGEAMKGPYTLSPSYHNVFRVANDLSENLFTIRFMRNPGGYEPLLSVYFYPHPFYGWNFFHPEQSIVDEFEYRDGSPGRKIRFNKENSEVPFSYVDDGSPVDWEKEFALRDLRLRTTVIPVGEIHKIEDEEVSLKNENTMTGYCCFKYFEEGKTDGTSNTHYPIIRLSDVHLMRAEALIVKNGPNAESDNLINDIRKRAGLTKMLSGCTMSDLIHERRCELGIEGHRHFDLMRWGLAKETYAIDNGLDGSRNFVVGKHEVFPIPQSQIDLSQGVLVQNPGY